MLILQRNVWNIVLLVNSSFDYTQSHVQSGRIQEEQLVVKKDATPQECRVELVACPSCVIDWRLIKSNFSKNNEECGPDYIEFTEPPYGSEVSGNRVCSAEASGKSLTRDVLMRFVFSSDYEHAFDMLIEIKSE